jgi:amino-acid N-acetyltransferase
MPIEIRPATADDQESIVALVRSERLNPTGLHWQNFVVAEDAGRIVGAAQIRKHKDGSRELASLVVEPSWRARGLAARLIETLLASEHGHLFVITSERRSAYFARWRFQTANRSRAPWPVQLNYYISQVGGGMVSLLLRRELLRLVILDRQPRLTSAKPL